MTSHPDLQGRHHRPEIDGLRAIAVLPVILFHAGFAPFRGGFVGVDIFFVISNYLITSILIRELEAGRFTFAGFYERRARRILPALFLVMACCIPFAWMWMLPTQMQGFSASLISVLGFVSNFYFSRQNGYFNADSDLKPLHHTWSLAVEEQFYIFFPIALLLLWRFGRRACVVAIAIAAVLSFALCEYASRTHFNFNFYSPATRTWELALGSLGSFVALRPHRMRDEAVSLAGLAAIIQSIFLFDSSLRFPSAYGLLPVVGTVAILVCGHRNTAAGRILSWTPLVGIGLVSYSAYLWHQPLLAFLRIRVSSDPSTWVLLGTCALSLLLAYASWRFVEVPWRIRKSAAPIGRATLIAIPVSCVAAFLVFSLAAIKTSGLSWRFPEGLGSLEDRIAINYGLDEQCNEGFTLNDVCRTGTNPTAVLWGDSFAMHLADALRNTSNAPKFVQMTRPQCAPLTGLALARWEKGPVQDPQACIDFNRRVLKWIADTSSIRSVVLSSQLSYLLRGDPIVLDGLGEQHRTNLEQVAEGLRQTLVSLKDLGKDVTIVSAPPNNGTNLGACLLRTSAFATDPHDCDFQHAQWSKDSVSAHILLERLEKDWRVVWLDRFLCEGGPCRASVDGRFIYRDAGHLSHEGSALIGKHVSIFN